jgi:predicted CopG family antitoxin
MTTTTVAVTHETKELLRQLGEKGESYDDVINKLIKEASWKKLDARWNKILEDDEFIPLDEL